MKVIKFHGTKHPVTAYCTAAELRGMRNDPAVQVISYSTDLVNLSRWEVVYQFLDPKRAALDMELPYEILMKHEAEGGEKIGV